MSIYDGYYYSIDNRFAAAQRELDGRIIPQAHARGIYIMTPGRTTIPQEVYAFMARSGSGQTDLLWYGTTVYNIDSTLGDYQCSQAFKLDAVNYAPYTQPYMVYVETAPISELDEPNTYINEILPRGADSDNLIWELKRKEFGANAVYVKRIIVMDNSNDGNYNPYNKRQQLPRSAEVCVMGTTQARILYYPDGRYQSFDGGNYGYAMRSIIKPLYQSPTPFRPIGDDPNWASRSSALANGMGGLFKVHACYKYHYLTNEYYDEFSAWDSLADLQRDLNQFGVPYTFDYEAAEDINTDELPDYEPDGVDDNPEGGGDGDGDNISDDIEFPDVADMVLPSALAYTTVCLTSEELNTLTDIVWSPKIRDLPSELTVLANSQPLTDSVISLRFYPFDVELNDPEHVVSYNTLTVGWSADMFGGGVLQNGYYRIIDAGYFDLHEYYGTFLDYSPHTSIDIWLPYIGYKSLPVDLVQNTRISVKYYVDFVDGLGTAVIWADDKPIALYTGALGIDVALTGRDNAAKNRQVVDNIGTVVSGVGRIGAGIPKAVATKGAVGLSDIAGGAAQAATGIAQAMYQDAPTVHFGTSGGENWMMLPQQCHLRITRAVSATPANYINESGYPSTYTGKLSSFTGYVSAQTVTGDFDGIPSEDVQRIIDGLRAGVHIRGW